MVSLDNFNLQTPIQFQVYSYRQFSGLTNMALDHYFAANFKTCNKAIIRFYGWNPFCLSLGYHQSGRIIDTISLTADGYDLVKRPTGGRAIFHSDELTYSVIFPRDILDKKDLYNFIHQIFLFALTELGYNVTLATGKPKLPKLSENAVDYPCFTRSAETEVEYDGKKLIGSAQKIYPNAILQHGSILIRNTHKMLAKYLSKGEKERYLIEKEIQSKTICLNGIRENNIKPNQIEQKILTQLESHDKISLIYNELGQDLIENAIRFYQKEFENK